MANIEKHFLAQNSNLKEINFMKFPLFTDFLKNLFNYNDYINNGGRVNNGASLRFLHRLNALGEIYHGYQTLQRPYYSNIYIVNLIMIPTLRVCSI